MSVDSCVEIKTAPFSGVTKSGRVWRKVPESNAGGGGGGGMISQFLVLSADLILKSKKHLSCIDHHVSIVSVLPHGLYNRETGWTH